MLDVDFNKDLSGVYLACVLHVLKARHRLSQRDVAAILGMPPQLLSDLKYARKPLTPALMTSIANAFGFQWQDIAKVLPPWWGDRDEVIRRNKDNPALAEENSPLYRYRQALLLEVPRLDSRIFPELKEQRVPTRTEAGLTLPIRDHPTAGNPALPPGYSGYTSVVPEPAMQIARYAEWPYLLRLLGEDRRGRFFPGDLLLVDQRIGDRDAEQRTVVVIRYGGEFILARRTEYGYEHVLKGAEDTAPISVSDAEVVGVVKASVWSEIR